MDLRLLILASVIASGSTKTFSVFVIIQINPSPPCQNGGTKTNGLCICPDDFTGQFCEKSNVCKGTRVQNFSFPKTIIGQASYSTELCPSTTINAGFPKATAQCLNETFSAPQELICDLTLETIDTDLSNNGFSLALASSTQILTSKPEQLSQQNISVAVKIVSSLLSYKESTQEILLVCIITVSQLLNTSTEQQFNNVTTESLSSLTKTLQHVSLKVDNGSLLVQPNIAIYTVIVSHTLEVQLTLFSAQPSMSLSANRIKINDTFAIQDDRSLIDVQLDAKLRKDTNGAKLGFVLYNNNRFFRSKVFQPTLNLKIQVISVHMEMEQFLESVTFLIRPQESKFFSLHDFTCVNWDQNKYDWSTKHCNKTWKAGNPACKCTGDMTATLSANFAMLMTFRPTPEISQALNLISKIGCGVSVLGLIITVIFQILTRKSRRSSPTILLVSICVCMTIVYLLFLAGIQNQNITSSNIPMENNIPASDIYTEPDQGLCTVVTALLQYFLLATFTWSSLYAAHIFLLLKNTMSGPPRNFISLSLLVGWGLPAVVVGTSLGITYQKENPLNYRQEAICWLAVRDQQDSLDVKKPMVWGFLLPVAAMLLFNITVLLYFSYSTCRTNPDLNSSQVTPLRNKMLACVSISVVLGVSWIIGYFLLLEADPITHYILSFAFCLTNTTQGIQIFVLFTLKTRAFKQIAYNFMPSLARD